MRKNIQVVASAFLAGNNKRVGNVSTDGQTLFLFGNPIARKKGKNLEISTCGFSTMTTNANLGGLLYFAQSTFRVGNIDRIPHLFRDAKPIRKIAGAEWIPIPDAKF